MMVKSPVAEPFYRHPFAVPPEQPVAFRVRVAETLVIAAGYWLLSTLGQLAAVPPGNVTPIYPAAGLALTAVLLRGERVWLAIALGQFASNTPDFANFDSLLGASLSIAVGLAIASGATLQALAAAIPLRRLGRLVAPFEHVADVFVFFAAIICGCLISSTIGVLALSLSQFLDWSLVPYVWSTWYLGDLIGQVLFVPLLMTLPALGAQLPTRERIAEACLIVVTVLVIAAVVFLPPSYFALANFPISILPVPLVLWGTIRFEHAGGSILMLGVYLIGIFGTWWGYGPFHLDDENVSLMLFHLYIGVTSGTALLLAASLKERSNSEAALRAATSSLVKTQFAVDQAGDAIFILRPDASFEYANLQAAKGLGYTVDELKNLCVPDVDPNFPAARWPDFWENEIRSHPMQFESTLLRRDGTTFPVEISVNHLEIDGDERACAIVKNVTERKAAEQALRHAEARLSQALTAGNIGLWDWDVVTNQVYYSPQFKIQLGYSGDDELDSYLDWESRLHPDDHDEAISCIRAYFAGTRDEYDSTFRLRHRDGTYRWIISRGAAFRDADGEPLRMIGVHIDITEERLRNEELERSNLELQQFAYAASHDLQEPLRSIGGFTQLLERRFKGAFDAAADEWIESIVSSSKRMKTLLDDLMAYTRLDSRSRPFAPVPLDEIVVDVLGNLHSSIQDSHAKVQMTTLPTVFGDRTQLVQLFQNLIGNAVKFHGPEPPLVKIHAERNDTDWHLMIEDNGIGIDPKYHQTIFEVFRRLHHRSEQPGNGIGLAICRRIVQRHRGEIWVDSQPGSGSRFCFTLPVDHREPSENAS